MSVLEPAAGSPPRAVAVVLQRGRVLLVERRAQGREYAVLPGGGIKPGESPEQAALRELFEETTLTARVERLLWRVRHRDREATYFLMTDVRGAPTLSGEEARARGPANSYVVSWVSAEQLVTSNLQPTEIRDPLAALLA